MSEQFIFQEAQRKQLKARIGLCSPAGYGKTYSALVFATVLAEAEGGRVAVIDTENGSAALYADESSFLHLRLAPPYAPIRYTQAMEAAVEQGASVVVVDSLSHAWASKGGVLDIKDQASRRQGVNDFTAWRDATPEHERLVEALVYSPIHVIATMRSKVAYVMDQKENGRTEIRKVGMAPVQREGMDYEFTMVAELDATNTIMVTKSRCKPLARAVVMNPDSNPAPTYEMARTFLNWLQSGAPQSKFADWPWMDLLVDEHGEAKVLGAINEMRARWIPPGPPKATLLECVHAPADFQKAVYDLLNADEGAQGDDWGAPSTNGHKSEEAAAATPTGQGDPSSDVGTDDAGASPDETEGVERTAPPEDESTPSQPSLGGDGGPGSATSAAVPSEANNGNGSVDRDRLVALISNAVEGNINLGRGRARATEAYIVTRYTTAANKKDLPTLETFDDVIAKGDIAILAELSEAWDLEEKLGATV